MPAAASSTAGGQRRRRVCVGDMRDRASDVEKVVPLETGDAFFAGESREHDTHPRGDGRILQAERRPGV
jgi:hypothetical protein